MSSGRTTMKVGLDLRLHAYAPGGISRYARRLAQALAEILPAEQLTLVMHRKERERLALPGVRIKRAWTPPHHRLERWALGAEILPLGLDLFHSTDFIPPAWGARRMVATIHDLNFLHYPDYLTAEARRYYNEQITWAVNRADAILVDSYATQQDLVTLLSAPVERITVAHLAASPHFRPLPEAEIDRRLSRYELERGYVLFVGVWEPRKNLTGLFEAYAMLRAGGLTPPLVIAGRPGWLYDEIYTRLEDLALTPYVRFIQQPDRDALVALYNGAAVLVMPSFYEGFGFPPLEAMQCGIPAVVADRASLPEVVGEAGLLIDPDEPATMAAAVRRLLEDPDLAAHCREAGFAQARRFSWRATAEKTLKAYRLALSV